MNSANATIVTENESYTTRTIPLPLTAESPERSDALSDFLKPCQLRCQSAQPWRLTAPWGIELRKAGPGFLIVKEGSCLLRASGSTDEMTIRQDDLVVFTGDGGVVLYDRLGSRLAVIDQAPEAGGQPMSEPLHLGGGGPTTRVLWGTFGIDDDYTRQAFSLLPAVLVARGNEPEATKGLVPFLQIVVDELESGRAGGEVLVNRLLHGILVYALRATRFTLPNAESFLPALCVPGLGMALAGMHARPEHDWSVRELAEVAGFSRSKFAILFMDVLGRPPFDYLRSIRMRLACQLLTDTDRGIKEIAARVGYATEASFSNAFTRYCGCAPGVYRHQQKAARAESRVPPA